MDTPANFPEWLKALNPAPMRWGGLTVWSADVPASRLRANDGRVPGIPRNPRRWSDEQLELLARSLRETPELFAARGCLCVIFDGTPVVIGGNMRLAAARSAGMESVPCIIYPQDTDTEVLRQVALKDNGSFGDWDTDLLRMEWPDYDLAAFGIDLQEGAEEDPDDTEASEDGYTEAEADTAPPVTAPGDVWALGDHRLMCGDSTDAATVAALMDGTQAQLLLTDPPYNVAYEGKTDEHLTIANDRMDEKSFVSFLAAAFKAADSVMQAGAAFYLWHAALYAYAVHSACRETGWQVRQELIWNKNSMVLGRQDYQWKHEPCLYGWKGGAPHWFADSRSETTVVEDRKPDFRTMKKDELVALLQDIYQERRCTTVIDENRPNASLEHPTMKPVKLMGRLIRNSSRRGDTVLDLFGGSGSTLVACEQLGRRAMLMELDPHYCDVIVDRWEKLTGRKAERINKLEPPNR